MTLLPNPRACGTVPLIFHEKGMGVRPLPAKKLLPVDSTMGGKETVFLSVVIVTRLETSRARPKESNPGPIFAVVPGTETVTEAFENPLIMSLKVSLLLSGQSIPRWGGIIPCIARALESGFALVGLPLIAAFQSNQGSHSFGSRHSMVLNGGEGGIRTLGTLLEYGALAKRCFRPLSHLTLVSH